MPVYIADPETSDLVARLAQERGLNKTEAVRLAVMNELMNAGIDVEAEKLPQNAKDHALVERLDAELRRVTGNYVKLRERITSKPSGSRIYQMLARHGAVEVVRRMVEKRTDALSFVMEHGYPELAFESVALNPEFGSIIDEKTKRIARENLDLVEG